mmetsp:Transcript_690/g.2449  ORF Transcript_690/g.2449 Transcript_690/m.2449 type:complete len:207 (+) Transcript_690:135-755(+)
MLVGFLGQCIDGGRPQHMARVELGHLADTEDRRGLLLVETLLVEHEPGFHEGHVALDGVLLVGACRKEPSDAVWQFYAFLERSLRQLSKEEMIVHVAVAQQLEEHVHTLCVCVARVGRGAQAELGPHHRKEVSSKLGEEKLQRRKLALSLDVRHECVRHLLQVPHCNARLVAKLVSSCRVIWIANPVLVVSFHEAKVAKIHCDAEE